MEAIHKMGLLTMLFLKLWNDVPKADDRVIQSCVVSLPSLFRLLEPPL